MSSIPPPAARPPATARRATELAFALEASRGRRKPRREGADRLILRPEAVVIEHGRLLHAPLELPLAAVKVAAVDAGPARMSGPAGRFPVLRRLSATAVIPRSQGIEGWLWTSTGGSGLTSLGEEDEAPNVALVFTKPLQEPALRAAFDPDVVAVLAARSPLGSPAVPGVLLRVHDALAAAQAFGRWGFQDVPTDREVPPTLRRHLPADRPADPTVHRSDHARAATSVGPPGMA